MAYSSSISAGRIATDEETQRALRAAGDMTPRETAAPSSAALASALRFGGSTYRYGDGAGSASGSGPAGGGPSSGLGAALGYGTAGRPATVTSDKKPRIIYATRTHSQIAQVVKELKRSGYAPQVAVLGSRAQVGREELC